MSTSPLHAAPAIARAAARQAATDLRAGLVGTCASILIIATSIVLVSRVTRAPAETGALFGPMFLAGSIGAISCFITLQIASEAYNDRIGGALLRVRILPHGPLTWAIGKTISSIIQTVAFQGAILLGGALFVAALPMTPSQAVACLPLVVLSAFATAPLGFILSAFTRGAYSLLATFLPVLALVGTSGVFLPLGQFPFWVQAIQLALPTYWSGHLTRWALVGDPSWEVSGAFSPVLALAILAAWTVLGFAAASFVVRRSFRKETIGSLARAQSTIRSQTGL